MKTRVVCCAMLLCLTNGLFGQSAAFKVDTAGVMLLKLNTDAGFFLGGSYGTGMIPVSGAGSRTMWYPAKAAFRTGYVDGTQWDADSTGNYSFASGYGTKAIANYSTALGYGTIASGLASTAMGYFTSAGNAYSTAMGISTTCNGYVSTSMGYSTIASGDFATAIGLSTTANSFASVVLGRFNLGGGTPGSWVATDPLFEIGIGTSSVVKANAMTVLKNGKVGIGTNMPAAALEISGFDGFLATGLYGTGSIPANGTGTRLMWYPAKAAFRAGYVSSTQWNADSCGGYSFASGRDTKAKAVYSTAMGDHTSAIGYASTALGGLTNAGGWYSTAMGHSTTASGDWSTTTGWSTTASGEYSTATGASTTASGQISTATGYQTYASGYASTAMGKNTGASNYAATALGDSTVASGMYSTSLGKNTGASNYAATAMGTNTTASGSSSLATGYGTTASGDYSTAMGTATTASGIYSTAMGASTTASGPYSTAMGEFTIASGTHSTAMGRTTIADANYTTALGAFVSTNGYAGSFIVGDFSTVAVMNAAAANSFRTRFAGGYTLYTNSGTTIGVSLAASGSSWSSISDSTKKCRYRNTDPENLLSRFSSLRLGSWNYIADPAPAHRHYGPMAQEWFAAFGHDSVGAIGNDTTLATADVDGIAYIAIQALEKRTAELRQRTAELEASRNDVTTLRAEVDALRVELREVATEIRRSGKHTVKTTAAR